MKALLFFQKRIISLFIFSFSLYSLAQILPDGNGIVYVTANGTGNGSNWTNPTSDLQGAINATGVTKVFVAIGNYNVGVNSFVMKNNVAIYGGFNPSNGIVGLDDNRILPNKGMGDGSILNGQNVKPLIWNDNNGLTNTAVLDGFTLMNGKNASAGAIFNNYVSPTFNNLVIRNNSANVSGGGIFNQQSPIKLSNTVISDNTAQFGGGVYNINSSNAVFTNVILQNNTATLDDPGAGGGAIFNQSSDLKLINVEITGNNAYLKGGGIRNLSGNPELTNVTIANNNTVNDASTTAMEITAGNLQINNSIVYGAIAGIYTPQYSLVENNADFTNGNIDATGITLNNIFTDPTNSDYTLKDGSDAINAGSNTLFTGLDENTKDLAGNARVCSYANGGIIDMGAYESPFNSPLSTDGNGIIYVRENPYGNGSGKDWENATSDLHNAISTNGVQKVFVAIGNFPVGANSFIMKNNVEIYGGFDPDNNIKTLNDDRILPNHGVSEGSVLDGQNVRPVIWNDNNGLDNTAVLDGFTVKNGYYAAGFGGGIHNVTASPNLKNLVVKNNTASAGGGIYAASSSIEITNVIISHNHAYSASMNGGGGMFSFNSSPVLTNALIINNTVNGTGGGFLGENGNPVFNNVTFAGNEEDAIAGTNITLNNCIVYKTEAFYDAIYGTYTAYNSLIEGSSNTANSNIDATGITLENIFTNPSADDYTLKSSSPAINAGDNTLFVGLNASTIDLAGNPRVHNFATGIIDMGAYESPYDESTFGPDANGIIYVKENGAGDKTGKSWEHATGNLARAVSTNGVQQVWVSVGTYNSGNIQMKNSVAIYGGFDPDNGIDDLADNRIFPNSITNIEGSVINGQNTKPIIFNDNNNLDNSAILDGFTLTNGKGTSGAGIYNNEASPTLSNLWIKGNTADDDGGGIYNFNSSSPLMTHITVSDNTARYGGGIFNRDNSSPVMTDVSIKNNTVGNDGAGMYNDVSSSPVMTNVSFTGNTATNDGGAMYNRNNSSPVVTNALIVNNAANSSRVAIRNETSSPSFTNATIANNTGASNLFTTNGSTSLANSIVFGTTSGIYTAQYSLVEGNTDFTNGNLDAGSLTSDDVFTDPANGVYTLKDGSVAVNSGSNALFANLDEDTKDLAGNLRLQNGIIDLGAYESAYETVIQPDVNGIVYVTPTGNGNGSGRNWENATSDLQGAINATGTQKVFVAVGNYNVPSPNSFVMKNNVAVYGGFDPDNGIKTLSDARVLPTFSGNGSILNGMGERPVIWSQQEWNEPKVTFTLDGFTITGGLAQNGQMIGSAIHLRYTVPTLTNLIIKNNHGGLGILYLESSTSGKIQNIALVDNILDNTEIHNANSAIAIVAAGGYTFDNLTIVNNKISGSNRYNAFFISGTSATVRNSIILGSMNLSSNYISDHSIIPPQYGYDNGSSNESNGDIILPPNTTIEQIFTNPSAGDYRLKLGSPVINAGSNASFAGLTVNSTDVSGNPRVYNYATGGIIDLGAYESPYEAPAPAEPDANGIIYVRKDAAGDASGSNWDNALSNIETAIHTTGVQKVFVAVGNYNVGGSSFILKNGVSVYGGFDPDNNIKTLDDNRIMPDAANTTQGSILNGQNARPVIWNVFDTATPMDNTAVLDGFTITGGKPTRVGAFGGGMYNENASPTLRNLVFRNNTGNYLTYLYSSGGGLYNKNSSPQMSNVTITENTAFYGGGMYNNNSNPQMNNVTITGNTAQFDGGGLYNKQSSPSMVDVKIMNNKANYGGGVFNQTSASPQMTNVLIAENTSYNDAGGMYNDDASSPILTNTTLAGNSGNDAMHNRNSSVSLNNSIVYGGGIGNENGGTYTAQYSLIQGSTDNTNGNLSASGITAGTIFTNDYTLKENSPAINRGNNALFANLDGNTKDLAGNARVYDFANGGLIDLGAYESEYNMPVPDNNGIIYVRQDAVGNGSGKDWENATSDFYNAVLTTGATKVFVAVGNHNLGDHSIILKNNVAVYGGFDPDNDIRTLDDNRILPNPDTNVEGTIINGQNVRPVIFNNNNGVNNTAILDGFTLTNGKYTTGGGIYNNGASPTLKNLWIKGNTATSDGGGIYNVNSSSPLMTGVTLSNNTANYAGGIFNRNNSSPIMTNMVIKANSANDDGGGMYNDNSASPVMTNVSITGNTAKNGAGMYNRTNSLPVLTNVLIVDNTATANGAAIRNEATSSPTLINVTVANNNGSTAWYATDGTATLANSILFGTISGTYTAQYSLVEGNTDTTNGNIDATGITVTDIFTDPTNGDYTLKDGSIAINAGNNALFPNLDANTLDLAGNSRVFHFATGGIIDMGAYENPYSSLITPDANNILYVDINVTGGNGSGDSWANAIPQLADAMKYARAQFIADNTVYDATPLKIYVAKGTYKPMYSARNNYYTVDEGRDNAFTMVKNVQIYGGFDPANGIDDLSDTRIFDDNGSVLSGDIYNNQLNNAYHVVVASNAVGNAVLDGFTISDARSTASSLIYVNGYPVDGQSGALACIGSSPTIVNCTFKYNSVFGLGGGIYNIQSSPTITNCNFHGNSAYNGGGIYNSQSSPVITNCSFTINGSVNDGAAIYNNSNAVPVITNCSFVNNQAIYDGGAIYNDASSPIIINALFANNNASGGIIPNGTAGNGGAIYNSGTSSPQLTNVTIANNTGLNALYAIAGSTTINNSIVFGTVSGNYTAKYSLIEGNTDLTNGNLDGGGLTPSSVFINPSAADYTLKSGSVAIDAGSNALFTGLDGNTKDLAGNPRLQNGIIDMGAFEFGSGSEAPCYRPANLTGTGADTKIGISTLEWAGINNQRNWPMVRKSGFIALESNTKGFVVSRLSTADLVNISQPQEGMMVYDTTANCLKIFSDGEWKCFNSPACP